MRVQFACPSCRTVLQAPAHHQGATVACPRCGQHLCLGPPSPGRRRRRTGRLLLCGGVGAVLLAGRRGRRPLLPAVPRSPAAGGLSALPPERIRRPSPILPATRLRPRRPKARRRAASGPAGRSAARTGRRHRHLPRGRTEARAAFVPRPRTAGPRPRRQRGGRGLSRYRLLSRRGVREKGAGDAAGRGRPRGRGVGVLPGTARQPGLRLGAAEYDLCHRQKSFCSRGGVYRPRGRGSGRQGLVARLDVHDGRRGGRSNAGREGFRATAERLPQGRRGAGAGPRRRPVDAVPGPRPLPGEEFRREGPELERRGFAPARLHRRRPARGAAVVGQRRRRRRPRPPIGPSARSSRA